MEFRTKALVALAAAAILSGQPAQVRHDHVWKHGEGTLTVSEHGVVFDEKDKPGHSHAWKWDAIQQLELGAGQLRILMYDDARWRMGRDREYVFSDVPASFATSVDSLLAAKLGAKYVARVAIEQGEPLWSVQAKLRERLGGSEGELQFRADRLVYSSIEAGESRTWPVTAIESVSTSGPFELTVATGERAGWTRGSREFRFQLKSPLADADYQRLWRAVNQAKGLNITTEHHQ